MHANASESTTMRGLKMVVGDGTGGEGLRHVLLSMTRHEVARVRMKRKYEEMEEL